MQKAGLRNLCSSAQSFVQNMRKQRTFWSSDYKPDNIDLCKFAEEKEELTVNLPTPNCVSTALLQEDTVELDDDSTYIIDQLLGSSLEREVITIWGLGGSGKATLARKVQDDLTVRSRFSIHSWVTISQEFQFRQVLLKLVCCITGNEFQEISNDQFMDKSYKALKGWRYLIVIDDAGAQRFGM